MRTKTACYTDRSKWAIVSFILLSTFACGPRNNSESFDYGTKSDSARYYYLNGFHEILDNGRWTESEKSYRKALEFDPNYTLGKSLVGRITRNLNEREKLLQELLDANKEANKYETLLLDVYALSIEAYNDRDKGIKGSDEFKSRRKKITESNFREFIHKYPDDDYVKAEYIEWLHLIHGPKVALDSLRYLTTERQKKLGFYISYAGSLELELGNIENAIQLSENLKELMADSTYTSYMKLKAEIYMVQDSLQKAKEYIDYVVSIDPNHVIALGMQSKINQKLKNK